jgi:hypothetical protein
VREAAVPDIWISDRRCTLLDNASGAVQSAMGWPTSSQLYLPRVLGLGEPGSDTIISQDIKGTADNVHFTFGALAPIPANTNVRLAITSVGTTYPGTDLTVFVYS